MPAGFDGPQRYFLISVDVENYSRRLMLGQHSVQRGLVEVLAEAAQVAHLDRSRWFTQEAGDGELALVPADVSEVQLVDDFVRELTTALAHHNRDLRQEARLRLRVAMHHGTAARSANGFSGRAVVEVSRLVNADVLKTSLALADDVDLALIVSSTLFEDVVAEQFGALRPEEFRRVRLAEKGYEGDAWISMPGSRRMPAEPLARQPVATPARYEGGTQIHHYGRGDIAGRDIHNTYGGSRQ